MANGKIPTPHAIDLLWQNPNPTASFAPQTVAVDLSGYTFVMVVIRQSDTAGYEVSTIIPNVVWTSGRALTIANYRQLRAFQIVSTGVSFEDGQEGAPAGNVAVNNARAIPVFIYGIK